MNKYKWIWAWRTFVHEMKYVVGMIVIVYAFMCATARAEEREPMEELPKPTHWSLVLVMEHDLVDHPRPFAKREECVQWGINFVKSGANGFICEQEIS